MDSVSILLGRIDWQIFAGLSYSAPAGTRYTVNLGVPSLEGRRKMLFAFSREVAALDHMNFFNLIWAGREEQGELGRFHWHYLAAGLMRRQMDSEILNVIGKVWRHVGGGIPNVREFDPTLDGVGYVLKGISMSLRDSYEVQRFGCKHCDTIVSKSLLTLIQSLGAGDRPRSRPERFLAPEVLRTELVRAAMSEARRT